jgi:hypothetical protein
MELFKNQLLNISQGKYTKEQLVSILLLTVSELELYTISEMARRECKTPSGIRNSKRYKKIEIGSQLFAIKGLKEDSMPF